MTKRELIEALKDYDDDTEIYLEDWAESYLPPAPLNMIYAEEVSSESGTQKRVILTHK